MAYATYELAAGTRLRSERDTWDEETQTWSWRDIYSEAVITIDIHIDDKRLRGLAFRAARSKSGRAISGAAVARVRKPSKEKK